MASAGGRGSERAREVRTGRRTVTPAVLRTGGTSSLRAPLASGAERRSTSRGALNRTSRSRSYSFLAIGSKAVRGGREVRPPRRLSVGELVEHRELSVEKPESTFRVLLSDESPGDRHLERREHLVGAARGHRVVSMRIGNGRS